MTSGVGGIGGTVPNSNNQSMLFNGRSRGNQKACYSLKQLKEMITDIFSKKEKQDWLSMHEFNQNRETMEQFLNTYLN